MGTLSVIIATISDAIATNFTVAQIIQQLEAAKIDYEIILVDNGSDETNKKNLMEFLRFHEEFPITYYEYDVKGTIPPHSFGVTKAIGKYITMPDPHLILSPNYFKVMLNTLKELKSKNVEVVFSPFSVGSMTKKGGDYISGSLLTKPNPFSKPSNIGESCKMGDPPHPVLSTSMTSFICERDWFLKIGNMFPDSFVEAGGHTAESLLIGIPTWMFGKKCYVQPKVVVEHPVYRTAKGASWSANMHLSMAVAAYILGGQKYLDEMPGQYGAYVPGALERIPVSSMEDRLHIEKNAKYSLDELVDKWEVLRDEA